MHSIRHVFAFVVPAAILIACVGDQAVVPPVEAGTDATADASVSDAANDVVAPPPDTGTDATTTTDGSPPADAAVEAEAGKPTTTCIDQTLVSGAYNHIGCLANPASVSQGGLFAVGNYVNATLYGQPYCPIAYAIGSASVYLDKGQTFFRYSLTRKTTINDPGTTTFGTYWIQTNGNGDLTVEEMCNVQNKGNVKMGTLSIVGSDFTMTWKNGNTVVGQEKWTKQ